MKKLFFASLILMAVNSYAQSVTLTTNHCQTKTTTFNVTNVQEDVFIITDKEITEHTDSKIWTRYMVTTKTVLSSTETIYVCKEGSDLYNITLLNSGKAIEIDKQGSEPETRVYSN